MFHAILTSPVSRSAPLTKGKPYRVVDVNSYFGTYTVINDNGERATLSWNRFKKIEE